MKAAAVIVVAMSERPTPSPMADPTVVHPHIGGAADPTVVHTGVVDAASDDPTVVQARAGVDPDRAPVTPAAGASMVPVLTAAAIGGAVSLSLGVYSRVHGPTGETIFAFGFPTLLAMKAWFTTAAAALALVQALSAAWMWGRLPGLGAAPGGVATWHRWSGTLAFFFTLPVAYHCLWSLGFQDTDVPGARPLASRLRVLRRAGVEAAAPPLAPASRLGPARRRRAPRRPPHRHLVHVVVVVLHHRRLPGRLTDLPRGRN